MKFRRRRSSYLAARAAALTAISISLLALTGGGAWTQGANTIKIVVPLAPGGGADILARLLAEHIGRAQGTAVVVENRVGAGSVIGTEAVSRAAPDGNTL